MNCFKFPILCSILCKTGVKVEKTANYHEIIVFLWYCACLFNPTMGGGRGGGRGGGQDLIGSIPNKFYCIPGKKRMHFDTKFFEFE